MRRLLSSSLLALSLASAALLAGACGDDTQPPAGPDAGPDGPPGDKLAPCLPSPTKLLRPPTGQLPCELLPPNFVAAQAAEAAEAR